MRFHLVTLFTLALIALNTSLYSQDQPKHPPRGSVTFGAAAPPIDKSKNDPDNMRNVFVKISEEVAPAVVAVMPVGRQSNDASLPLQVQGLGSGIIISKQGHILTNYHVISTADTAQIKLADQTLLTAVKIGGDSLSDLAVLQIIVPIPDKLPVAFLGNSDNLQPGDWVAAIGSPFNLSSTITAGIVSALGRTVELDLPYQYFIQTDAAINPGNSGGALVDLNGAIVGVNSLILSPSGGFIGIGFAIPINLARRVAEELVYEGKVARGYLGISVQDLTPMLAKALGGGVKSGAVVTAVVDKGPSAKLGLEAGDVIVSLGRHLITSANELVNLAAAHRPGTKVKLTFFKGGKKEEAELTLGQHDKKTQMQQAKPAEGAPAKRSNTGNKCGVAVADINEKTRQKYGVPKETSGVAVTAVTPGILDERAMLQTGDIITRIKSSNGDWNTINSRKSYLSYANSLNEKDVVVMQVLRGGQTQFISFEIEKARKM
ncbi:MAG: trypsin-like peptidase domain-containing protein [Chitinispirillales bacterium]|jgi:serine protease Do|nr:trypsin-like peptidase domain-containing protein [Chitinispirillales bacterium]